MLVECLGVGLRSICCNSPDKRESWTVAEINLRYVLINAVLGVTRTRPELGSFRHILTLSGPTVCIQ